MCVCVCVCAPSCPDLHFSPGCPRHELCYLPHVDTSSQVHLTRVDPDDVKTSLGGREGGRESNQIYVTELLP